MEIYKLAEACLLLEANDKVPLTPKERQQVKDRFGEIGCSVFKTKEGKYFCCTHRARSKAYDSIDKMPKKTVEFISSTS